MPRDRRGGPRTTRWPIPGRAARGRPGITAAVLALLVSAGCRERGGEHPEALTLALPSVPHAALLHVAAANGYFAEEGLAVTVQPHRFGKEALDAVVGGRADVGSCAETPLVLAILGGAEVVSIATVGSSIRDTAVVALRSAGITTARDLAGKRVGVPRATSAEFFLDTLLLRQGLGLGAVRLVDLAPDAMPRALAGREVDAVAVWNPVVAELQARHGAEVVALYAEGMYVETHEVVVARDLVRRRPAAAEKVLRALLRAEAFVQRHPDPARRAVATRLGRPDTGDLFGAFVFQLRLEQSLVVLMEEEARWAIRTGIAPRRVLPDFQATLAAGPLLAVKPDAVRLLR